MDQDGSTSSERRTSRRSFVVAAGRSAAIAAMSPALGSLSPATARAAGLPARSARAVGPRIATGPRDRGAAGSASDHTSDLDRFIRDRMRAARVPGLAIVVVQGGRLLTAREYGLANVAQRAPVTGETVFMLASVSKTVTATALMQVFDDGGFGLDDDVNDHLPFPVRNPHAPGAPITPRMLLTHTSSLRDNWNVLGSVYVRGDSSLPLGGFLRGYLVPGGRYYDPAANSYPFGPGVAYRYCNVGAALAGYLVESITGIPFDRHCDERIFGPLGMSQTSWHLEGLRPRQVAMPYAYRPAQGTFDPYGQYGYPDYPDGELRTGAVHLARFLSAFIGFGSLDGTRILRRSTAKEMRRDQVPQIIKGQGLIWYYDRRGGDTLLGHNGGDSGVDTRMFFRPADGVGVIVLANGTASKPQQDQALQQIQDRLFDLGPSGPALGS